MNPLLVYVIKSAVYFSAFYLIYILLLSRDTMYIRNRAYLLFSALLSLVLPYITIHTNKPIDINFLGKVLSEVLVYGSYEPDSIPLPGMKEISNLQLINYVYLTGILFFGLRFIVNLLELIFLIIRKRSRGTNIIRFHGYNTSGFSALGHIFINSGLSREEEDEIIRHEQNHLTQYHFLDILFIEIIKILQWFNPVIYMADRSLRAIHEYQADEGCLKNGIGVINYQELLMNQVFNSRIFGLKNCFSNPKLIRKRMLMMTRQRTGSISNYKLLLALPVVAIELAAFSSNAENFQDDFTRENPVEEAVDGNSARRSSNGMNLPQFLPPPPEKTQQQSEKELLLPDKTIYEKAPFVVVEEMPEFPGGGNALLRHIAESVVYPETAKDQSIQGRVIVRFAVTAKGKVEMATVLKGVHPDLDNEALRVVNELPEFKPGSQGGVAVPVWYMVPITFTLK